MEFFSVLSLGCLGIPSPYHCGMLLMCSRYRWPPNIHGPPKLRIHTPPLPAHRSPSTKRAHLHLPSLEPVLSQIRVHPTPPSSTPSLQFISPLLPSSFSSKPFLNFLYQKHSTISHLLRQAFVSLPTSTPKASLQFLCYFFFFPKYCIIY
jgi:hypothetical protein